MVIVLLVRGLAGEQPDGPCLVHQQPLREPVRDRVRLAVARYLVVCVCLLVGSNVYRVGRATVVERGVGQVAIHHAL